MSLTFEEAATGVNTKIKIPRQEFCAACNGTGSESRHRSSRLPDLRRPGPARLSTGIFHHHSHLPRLPGRRPNRQRALHRMPRSGTRREGTESSSCAFLPASIPAPACALQGEGEPGPNGGPTGDLYVVLDVKEHPYFERRGADLYCTIPSALPKRAWASSCKFPGLGSEEKLKIPEGTQSGAVFRVRGKGLADPHGGGKGDLYYHVRVLTPTKLTRDQRKLIEQLGTR